MKTVLSPTDSISLYMTGCFSILLWKDILYRNINFSYELLGQVHNIRHANPIAKPIVFKGNFDDDGYYYLSAIRKPKQPNSGKHYYNKITHNPVDAVKNHRDYYVHGYANNPEGKVVNPQTNYFNPQISNIVPNIVPNIVSNIEQESNW
jgi:hypothetical protein